MDLVEAQHPHIAERIDGGDDDVGILGEDRDEVDGGLLVPVDFAGVERGRRGRGVGDIEPFDPVDLDHLAAGGKARRLLARHIVGVFDEHRLVAGNPFLLDEFERPGADRLRNLLERVGLGEPLGHHERHVARQFAERVEHQRKRRLERDGEAFLVVRGNRGRRVRQLLAERVALAPALDRGDAIGRPHRLPVMPFEAVAQGELPGQLVVAGCPLVDHLRLRLQVLVEREQGVEDHVAEISGDVRGGPDRVEAAQIRLRDEAQRLLLGLGETAHRHQGRSERHRDDDHPYPERKARHVAAPYPRFCLT